MLTTDKHIDPDILNTDLALERLPREEKADKLSGTTVLSNETDACTITDITIETEDAARFMGKPIGRYITLEIKESEYGEYAEPASDDICEALLKLIKTPLPERVLVAGLGNRHISPDSLGARCADKINVTRLVSDYAGIESKTQICAIAPGVLGVTGIETAEILQGICDRVDPQLIIAVDSLCARDIHRIGNTVQMTDTGIEPGAGLGNNRNVISSAVMGRRVICIGVPMVVYARTICHNVMEQLLRKQGIESGDVALQSVMNELDDDFVKTLVVTPTDIAAIIEDMSDAVAGGINKAFNQ